MDRRTFLGTLASGLLAAPLVAVAQPAGKVQRIGYLSVGTPGTTTDPRALSFRQGLREAGWVEDQSIVIEYRYAEGRLDRLPDLAAELVRLKIDLMIAVTAAPTVAAKNATGTIPIVMIGVADPVGRGFVASLARPGGNVTGMSYGVGTDTFGKNLELLKEVVPKVRRVAVLLSPAVPSSALVINNVKAAAQSLGLQLQLLEARGPDQFDGAFAAMAKERAGALFVVWDPVYSLHRARLLDLAAMSRLPAMYTLREQVEAGGLMSYGPDIASQFRRAAIYVDKILKGAKPADLPVEQPEKFEFVINVKTAKALGLTIPPSLLQRADQVIE